MSEPTDLKRLCTFFDPHPGFAGAAIRIPEPIRLLANELDGQTMTLGDALAKLRSAGIGEIRLVPEYDYISLNLYSGPGQPEHFFRVIRYR